MHAEQARPPRDRRVPGYQRLYRLFYRVGFIPWQKPSPPTDLLSLADHLPPARALDLGCGTGVEAVALAERGWQVTAVDLVPRALDAARRRATAAGVAPRFLQADVTRLEPGTVGDGYQLLIDLGCYHSLPAAERDAYVASVSRVAAPQATLLIYAASRQAPGPITLAGVTREEIATRFGSGWELLDAQAVTASSIGVPRLADRMAPWRYHLRRRATTS